MCKKIGPSSLYTFLNYCNSSSLEKEVLDCGAGGDFPKLSMFYEFGYKTKGIEISESQLNKANKYCKENNMELNIINGDMTHIPLDNNSISFIFSYNSIFHLTKKDTLVALKEIERVLKKGGLCYINLLSIEDSGFGEGVEVGKGEFLQSEYDEKVIHSYYEDAEADGVFSELVVMRKEKRIIETLSEGEKYKFAYIDYIVKK
jgi:ubiquinone/menaquinone biosynthesis C-methylase UbiE